MNITSLIKMAGAVALAISMTTGATTSECDAERARSAATPVITKSGDYDISTLKHKNLHATKPTKDCEYWVLYDIPDPRPGYDAVELQHVTTSQPTSVNLNKRYSFTYTDAKGKRQWPKNVRATTFVTKGCGPWYKK